MELVAFQEKKIRISSKNQICLGDLIKAIKCNKKRDEILKFSKEKSYEYDGNIYVKSDMAIKILEKYESNVGNEILYNLKENNKYKELCLISDCDDADNVDIKNLQKNKSLNVTQEVIFDTSSVKSFFIDYDISKFIGLHP